MNLFGFEFTLKRKQYGNVAPSMPLSYYGGGYGAYSGGGWWPVIREAGTGFWQRNLELRPESLISYPPVYACITLVASDVAKCRLRLVEEVEPDVWEEVRDVASPFLGVLRKPNRHQNRIQFFESWVTSKLAFGNAYILKERDGRGVVTDMTVLDPVRTKPLVADDGEIFYELHRDNLSGVQEDRLIVPSSEIIHDMTTLRYHPLCGIPPMVAAVLAATHGLNMQRSSITLFGNDARPGGFLTAPGTIKKETAERLKAQWEEQFSGSNRGRVAVMGDGLEYKGMAIDPVDAQFIEQMGLTGKMVCQAFNVPPHKVQVGDPPSYNNIEALNTSYYTDCLQKYLEAIELCLDEGLGLVNVPGKRYGTEFDTTSLLRMDSATAMKTLSEGVRNRILATNDARLVLGYGGVPGGEFVMGQHQDHSLAALAKRDAKEDPFETGPAPQKPAPPSESDVDDDEDADVEATRALLRLDLRHDFSKLADFMRQIERELADAA